MLAALVALAVRRAHFGYPPLPPDYARIAPREAAFLRAAVDAAFPSRGAIPVAGSEVDAPRYVDRWFEVLHAGKRFQIRLLFAFFEHATLIFWAPGPRGWRRFSALSLAQRIEVLHGWYASRVFARRLVFTALRSVLGLAYLDHPATLRFLRVAPYDFPTPVLDVDLVYPPIGKGLDEVAHEPGDLTAPSDGTPLALDTPVHPDYLERPL